VAQIRLTGTSLQEPERRGPAGRGVRSAGQRLARLRNWRVRSKLIAVLVIPAVAFLVVASLGIGATIQDARAFDRGSRLAGLGRQATALAHELQSERDRTAGYTAGRDKNVGAELAADQKSVDQAAFAYRSAGSGLHDQLGERLEGKVDDVLSQLSELGGLRAAIASGSLTRQAAFDQYSQIVDALLSVDAEIAQPSSDEHLSQSVRALNDLSRAKEVTSQIRGTLYPIAYRGSFAFGESQRFADLVAKQQNAFDQFQVDANESQRTLYANLVRGQAVLTAFRIQQDAQNRQSSASLGIDPGQWFAATTNEVEVMRAVESQLLDDVVRQSQELSTAAKRRSTANAVLIAAILGVALLALLLVARSMAGPLQRLRSRALDVAEHRLPEAVERLSMSETGDLDVRVEPIGIRSQDEIGQVAQAVDAIQQVAVRLATEQAALRQSIGDMFTNLARRSQTLIDRQLELIEDLERNEESPELLDQLFRLDHLATRMRRNAEDLIVLSGADPGRHWAQPMALVDVVRAAIAEVEEYQRVELLPLAELEVTGAAAIDVIHLLAELVENATVFSPPTTKVQIAGQAVPHGYVIEIEDRGLGMSEEDLLVANERLANPPEIDFALSRVLGLYVVGRLAQRHGIRVQLRHSWYGGVTALTLLPHTVLVWPDEQQAMPDRKAVAQAELPSPERPAERWRASEPAARPADHLPIFEAARSDWFIEEHNVMPERPAAPPPLPARRTASLRPPAAPFPEPQEPAADGPAAPLHPSGLQQRPPAEAGGGSGGLRSEAGTEAADGHAQPSGSPPVDGGHSPPWPAEASQPRAGDEVPPRPGVQDTEAVRITVAGLPRRIPRASLAPGISAATPEEPSDAKPGRSPDEVRSILSSYRSGMERGRLAAGDVDPSNEHPDEAP
jgi:signal transduction histidine kinase